MPDIKSKRMLYQIRIPKIYDKNRHGTLTISEEAIQKLIWERFGSDLGESRVAFSKTMQDWMTRRLSEVGVESIHLRWYWKKYLSTQGLIIFAFDTDHAHTLETDNSWREQCELLQSSSCSEKVKGPALVKGSRKVKRGRKDSNDASQLRCKLIQ